MAAWASLTAPEAARATFATQELVPVSAHAGLAALRAVETEAAEAAMAGGALAAVAGFDPAGWTAVRFRLWEAPKTAGAGQSAYRVGHVSVAHVKPCVKGDDPVPRLQAP